MEVSLMDILNAREDRVRLQQSFLQENPCPLVCFTMNIAGPVKTTPLIQRGFRAGLDALIAKLPAAKIRKQTVDFAPTGCTAMLSVDINPKSLKDICTELEESTPLGRLFDMDVLDIDGTKLERKTQRGCIVCGAPGRECAASRRHAVSQLQNVTREILIKHFAQADAERVAILARNSLINEVNTTPKPGLVDRRNNGSHTDMTISHFYRSANALTPYFAQCVKIGQQTAYLPSSQTFPLLRETGIQAEKTMYEATDGVNTHKGLIYTLGVLCGSIGRLWSAEKPIASTEAILAESAAIVHESVQQDFAAANGATAGERLYLQYGIGGIRAEIASGLPSVKEIGLPIYEKALSECLNQNDAGIVALLTMISKVTDTNLYHRGGKIGAQWAADAASTLLPNPSQADLERLDDAFIAKNLSPGGCADLLAVTYFLHELR